MCTLHWRPAQVLPPCRSLGLEDAQPPLAIAIVGRPNVGKSPSAVPCLHASCEIFIVLVDICCVRLRLGCLLACGLQLSCCIMGSQIWRRPACADLLAMLDTCPVAWAAAWLCLAHVQLISSLSQPVLLQGSFQHNAATCEGGPLHATARNTCPRHAVPSMRGFSSHHSTCRQLGAR